jgi:hypothetical protein
MPYITSDYREELDANIWELVSTLVKWSDGKKMDGCVNYIFTKILKQVYDENYHDYNAAIGVLECCKMELYRRSIAPYEDTKIKLNGDV